MHHIPDNHWNDLQKPWNVQAQTMKGFSKCSMNCFESFHELLQESTMMMNHRTEIFPSKIQNSSDKMHPFYRKNSKFYLQIPCSPRNFSGGERRVSEGNSKCLLPSQKDITSSLRVASCLFPTSLSLKANLISYPPPLSANGAHNAPSGRKYPTRNLRQE